MFKSLLNQRSLKYCVIVTSLFFVSLLAYSQDNTVSQRQKGRYGVNGSAYRIDAGGMIIRDRLAELEATNSVLEEQVKALQLELKRRNQMLAEVVDMPEEAPELAGRGGATKRLEETNLPLPQTSARPLAMPKYATSTQCAHHMVPLQQKLRRLESVLATKTSSASSSERNCHVGEKQLLAQAKQLEELEAELISLKSGGTIRALENEAVNSQLNAQDKRKYVEAYKDAKESNTRLSQELEESEKTIGDLEEKLRLADTAEPRAKQRGKLASATPVAPASSTSKMDWFEVDKKMIEIQTLITDRKKMIDLLRSRRRDVGVELSELVSSSGISLDKLRLHVRRKKSHPDVVLSGLIDIEQLLESDIKVLNRLGA